YRMVGNAEFARKSASTSGGHFRMINDNFPDNVVNPDFSNVSLKILGDMVMVDQAHERRGADVPSVRASELLNFAVNLGKQFQHFFFNGNSSVNADEFDGVKKLCPVLQKLTAATNGHTVTMGNSDAAKLAQQKFLELIEQLIQLVDGGAQALFMDGKTLSRLTTIAREFVTTQMNEFGQPVRYFNGIPVLSTGYNILGASVIPHNESCGSSSVCTSIYAIRFGERSDLSIATNIGLDVKDLGLVGSFFTHKVELDASPILLRDKALARLEGIIIS
ncbi:MAG: hypothetical protein HY965_01185, partial [Ignavibacteriales bacterium]|nr:hypothetical protein [Ignavibacteriales bacterium]